MHFPRIGIAGAGGIGSNVALHLVRSNIPRFTIIDCDVVEASNLNRQFFFADQVGSSKVAMLAQNLRRINPEIDICAVHQKITPENIHHLFADCDVIVEGLDGQEDKKMLIEALHNEKHAIIAASGIAGSDLAAITTKKIGNTYIIGDLSTDCADAELTSHKVVAVAAHMAATLLSLLSTKAINQ